MLASPLKFRTMKSQVGKDQTKSEKRSRSLGRCHQLYSAETFSSMARRRSSIGGIAESRNPPSLPSSRESSPTGRGRGVYQQPINKTDRVRSVSRTPRARNSEIGERSELRGRSVSRSDESEKENVRPASVPPLVSKKFKGSQIENECFDSKKECKGPVTIETINIQKTNARKLRRSSSQQDFREFCSVLGDDELLDALDSDHEEEKIIRDVYAQMKSHTIDNPAAVVKELENSGKQKKSDIVEVFAEITNIFASKLEKAEKHKMYLMVKLAIEQQHSQDLATTIQELLPDVEPHKINPSIIRKSNVEREQMSECLNKEAQNYFEQFVADSMADNTELPTAEVYENVKIPELQPALDCLPEIQLLNEAGYTDHIQPIVQSSAQREQITELLDKEAQNNYKEFKAQLINESSFLDDIQIVEQSSAQREQMSDYLNKEVQKLIVADSMGDGSELSTAEVNDNVEKPELQPAGDSLPETQLINEAGCIDHIQHVRSAAGMSDGVSLPWLEWETSLDTCTEDTMSVNSAPLSNSNAIEKVSSANNDKLDQGLPSIKTEDKDTPSGGIGSFLRDLFIVVVLLTV